MTTERTDKILPKRQVAIRKLHHHTDRRRAVSSPFSKATAAQINDAACEWYFDREITKECEMTAATLVNRQQMTPPMNEEN